MNDLAEIAWSDTSLPPAKVDRTRHFWTTRELALVREHYPAGGLNACRDLLPGRSPAAIYQKAVKLGLRRPPPGRDTPFRQRWSSTPAIDDALRRCYENPTPGGVLALAERIGRPRWWVSKRATMLGLKVPRFKEPPWTAAEDALLEQHAHKQLDTISKILARSGFRRTPTAVKMRLRRGQFDREDPYHYTASGLARLFGVTIKTITRWIDKGWLKARRRGTDRTPQQGGDQHWIHRRDVRAFVVDNAAAVDLRKVDKFWFIDLLAGIYDA